MSIQAILNIFTGQQLVPLFFKSFGIILSFMFLIYSIVVLRQTRLMITTLEVKGRTIFMLISQLQIVVALVVLLLAIFVL